MRVSFRKITQERKKFVLEQGDLRFECEIYRRNSHVCVLDGYITGRIALCCDFSGEEFEKEINQKLILYISDGLWNLQSQFKEDAIDVIEFFDGFIDIAYIFYSEVELIKSDYHTKE